MMLRAVCSISRETIFASTDTWAPPVPCTVNASSSDHCDFDTPGSLRYSMKYLPNAARG